MDLKFWKGQWYTHSDVHTATHTRVKYFWGRISSLPIYLSIYLPTYQFICPPIYISLKTFNGMITEINKQLLWVMELKCSNRGWNHQITATLGKCFTSPAINFFICKFNGFNRSPLGTFLLKHFMIFKISVLSTFWSSC